MTLRSWASTNRWLKTENCTVRWRTSSRVASPLANQRVYVLSTTTGWWWTTSATRDRNASRLLSVIVTAVPPWWASRLRTQWSYPSTNRSTHRSIYVRSAQLGQASDERIDQFVPI